MIKSYVGNYGEQLFYHIVYFKEQESVVNILEKANYFKGKIHWVMRLGNPKIEDQIFLELLSDSAPSFSKSKNSMRDKFAIETYIDVENGIDFTLKCMKIFKKIKESKEYISENSFRRIIKEEFVDEI